MSRLYFISIAAYDYALNECRNCTKTSHALSYVIHRADEKGVSIHSLTDEATEAQRGK